MRGDISINRQYSVNNIYILFIAMSVVGIEFNYL